MKGDLHIHSYYSDGELSPAEVMRKAKSAGCETVSLTDHDTLDGTAEAMAEAHKLGMAYITGVEVSALDKVETHILGYGVDVASERFTAFIKEQKARRRERAAKILAKLARHGMVIDEHMFDFHVERALSRSHIAAAIVQCGYEPDFRSAFDKWMRIGAPTYVPIEDVPPRRAIDEIHAAGGVATLAHPVRLNLDRYERTAYIEKLASMGLDALEAVYKESSRDSVQEFTRLAQRLSLEVTAGADFHRGNDKIIQRELSCPKITDFRQ